MPTPHKFLVVDPLAGVQTFARQLLQSQGFAADAILCCTDTDSGLAQGLVFKPDFLITDWFPKTPLNGLKLFQRLKEVQPRLQLSLLSFEVTPDHEQQAQAHGAHFLLKKPFTADQLKTQMMRSLEALAKDAPAPPRDTARLAPRAALPLTPPAPIIKPGDAVRYKGERHVAQYVVHRPGETVVQLKGVAALIPLHELQRV
jgi:DNA-binding NtrC family response regulator